MRGVGTILVVVLVLCLLLLPCIHGACVADFDVEDWRQTLSDGLVYKLDATTAEVKWEPGNVDGNIVHPLLQISADNSARTTPPTRGGGVYSTIDYATGEMWTQISCTAGCDEPSPLYFYLEKSLTDSTCLGYTPTTCDYLRIEIHVNTAMSPVHVDTVVTMNYQSAQNIRTDLSGDFVTSLIGIHIIRTDASLEIRLVDPDTNVEVSRMTSQPENIPTLHGTFSYWIGGSPLPRSATEYEVGRSMFISPVGCDSGILPTYSPLTTAPAPTTTTPEATTITPAPAETTTESPTTTSAPTDTPSTTPSETETTAADTPSATVTETQTESLTPTETPTEIPTDTPTETATEAPTVTPTTGTASVIVTSAAQCVPPSADFYCGPDGILHNVIQNVTITDISITSPVRIEGNLDVNGSAVIVIDGSQNDTAVDVSGTTTIHGGVLIIVISNSSALNRSSIDILTAGNIIGGFNSIEVADRKHCVVKTRTKLSVMLSACKKRNHIVLAFALGGALLVILAAFVVLVIMYQKQFCFRLWRSTEENLALRSAKKQLLLASEHSDLYEPTSRESPLYQL